MNCETDVRGTTDVAQRLKAFEEEAYSEYPKEELQSGCLALYEKEKAAGTELPAIIGLLRDHVEREATSSRSTTGDRARKTELSESNA
jgi:hypothetical protein